MAREPRHKTADHPPDPNFHPLPRTFDVPLAMSTTATPVFVQLLARVLREKEYAMDNPSALQLNWESCGQHDMYLRHAQILSR